MHAELVEDVVEMGADRLLADEQPLGNLAIGQAVREKFQDLSLAARQQLILADGPLRSRLQGDPGATGERLDLLPQGARTERGGRSVGAAQQLPGVATVAGAEQRLGGAKARV